MKKLVLFAVASITMMFMIFSAGTANAETASGICGDGVKWTYEDGTLTISGNGYTDHYEYQYNKVAPWYYNYGSKIQNIVIEDGVQGLGIDAFYNCSAVTSVTIPESVIAIGRECFYKCSSLSNISLPQSVTYMSIGRYAFRETAYSENTDNWENGVLYIGNYLIDTKSDELLSNFVIKSGTIIAERAFMDTQLTSLSIQSGVSSAYRLGDLFYLIPDTLSKIDIDQDSVVSDFAIECTNIARVNIGNNVSSIGAEAFKGCTNLRFLTLGQGLKKISQNAFNGCSNLSEITLPSSLQTIEQNAFSNCYSLDEIIIPDSVTSIIGDGVFPKRTVICGYRGSAAEEYAQNYGYTFRELDADEYITTSTAERINGTIVLSTSVSSDISKKTLHIALYDNNNTLVDYMIVPTRNSTDNAYVVFRNNPDVSYAKVFVWDSLKSMTPTAKAEKVIIQ